MHSIGRICLNSVLVAIGATLVPLAANAGFGLGGWKFSPTDCHAEDSTSLSRITYSAGKLRSSAAAGTANVVCPVAWESNGAIETTSAALSYIDTGSSNLSCTHYWTTSSGNELWSWGFTSSGSSSEPQWFQVDEGPTSQGSRRTWRCTLPASTLVAITGGDFINFDL